VERFWLGGWDSTGGGGRSRNEGCLGKTHGTYLVKVRNRHEPNESAIISKESEREQQPKRVQDCVPQRVSEEEESV